ncbi:hypothetical protein AG1IA_09321 [Rhizoctonia solani AG-1 IA]|uniref:Uncharacterized protein n=1 Tax=Thanatephorus cucumeris (strain AG1-IA) TaxID=983506 RepID=L8WJV9_THACA|nr:hypothetical protein AG1IA_09321 [Rhizoctonia solani AG-1 IA]
MNDRILPSLGYSPRELLTGVLTADRSYKAGAQIRQHYAPLGNEQTPPVDVNMALSYALRQDGAERALTHARARKRTFDTKIKPLLVEPGDLVQKYDPRWDNTHSNERKLAQRWSNPLRVQERRNASYVLEDLEGNIVSLNAHARHLRPYATEPKHPPHKTDPVALEESEPLSPGYSEDF